MRHIKSFLILSVITLFASPAFALDDTNLGNVVKLRSVGSKQAEAVRVLKLVRFVSGDANISSLVSGDAVSYSLVSDDGVSVIRPTASSDPSFAGIVAMTIQTADADATTAYDDTGRRNWGWIVVHGPANANLIAGSTNGHAAGDTFIASRDEGTIATYEGPTASTSTRFELRRLSGASGFFMDAVGASDTSAEVFVENV